MRTRFAFLTLLTLIPMSLFAADWPTWRGIDRTNKSTETGLIKTWPKDGPKLLWTVKNAGLGYSGIAVVGDTYYSAGAGYPKNGDKEFVFAGDVKTGKEKWRTPIDKFYDNNWGGGPRGTPTVDTGMVYVLSANGVLACLNAKDGSKVWSKDFSKDLGGKMMSGWGFCESVLVDGDRVICTPGGDKGTLAALNKKTGAVIWRSKDVKDSAAYSSIVIATIGGVKQYLQMTNKGIISVKADDGKFLWRSELAKNGTAVIPTPVFQGNQVFVTSGYGAGCGLVQINGEGASLMAEDIYDNKDMSNQHGGVILYKDHVFGHSDSKGWVCMDFATGKVVWKSDSLPKGSILYADESFYCYSERDGTMAKIEATTEGWKEQGRLKVPEKSKIRKPAGAVWTHPTISNGKLYLRDQEYIFCYDLKTSKS